MKKRAILLILTLSAVLALLALSSAAYDGYDYVLPMKYDNIIIGDKNIYFSNGGKWGIAALDGTVTSEAKYSSYTDAASKSAEIKQSSFVPYSNESGLFGYKNGSGEICIPAKYEIVSNTFEDGAAIVRLGGKFGIINTNGDVLFDFVCDTLIKASSCKRYCYTQNGRTGFIDGNFNISAEPFLIADSIQMYDDYAVFQASGGKYGLVAYDGRVLSGAIWDFMRSFNEGLAAVGVKEDFYGINVRWGYINKNGETIIPVIYTSHSDEALDFSEGMAGVCDGEAGLYIDIKGDVKLRLKSGCFPHTGFSGGVAAVGQNLIKHYIDLNGDTVMSSSDGVKWYNAGKLKNGLAVVSSRFDSFTAGTMGVIRYRGAIPSSWAAAEVAAAEKNGLIPAGFVGSYTKPVTRAEYCRLAVNLVEITTGKKASELAEKKDGIFTDTNDTAVLYAQAMGIVDGRGGGIFDPDSPLNRQEAAKILVNTFKACAYLPAHISSMPSYSDRTAIESWANEGIWYNGEWGVMIGVGDNRFDPLGSYTREQSILTMTRLYNTLKKNRPEMLYINPYITVFYKDTVNSHSSVPDYTVRMSIPADWSYNYTSGELTRGDKLMATLSRAEIYIDGLPEKSTDKNVYTFDSDIIRTTLTFHEEYAEAAKLAASIQIYDRRVPSMSENIDDFLHFRYRDAAEAMGWFDICTLYSRTNINKLVESYRLGVKSGGEEFQYDADGYVKLGDAELTNYAALEAYLKSLFSDEIAARLLGTGMYKDVDGALWGLGAARGTDISVGDVSYSYVKTDNKITYTATYERLGDDLITVTGYEKRDFICENINGTWKWTAFELFY